MVLHTEASQFKTLRSRSRESTALSERRLVCATHIESLGAWRITMTQSVFDHAACALFLVAGREKAAALRAVLRPEPGAERLPAALIEPVNGEVLWFVDAAAAAEWKRG